MPLSPLVQRMLRESASGDSAPMGGGAAEGGTPSWVTKLQSALDGQGLGVTPGKAPMKLPPMGAPGGGHKPHGGGGGGGAPAAGAYGGGSPQAYVQAEAAKRGWTGGQWNALHDLIRRESSWNPTISNPTSRAFGLFQFMPMHWKQGGYLPQGNNSNLQQQVAAGLRYVSERYGTPQGALNHWKNPTSGPSSWGNWY